MAKRNQWNIVMTLWCDVTLSTSDILICNSGVDNRILWWHCDVTGRWLSLPVTSFLSTSNITICSRLAIEYWDVTFRQFSTSDIKICNVEWLTEICPLILKHWVKCNIPSGFLWLKCNSYFSLWVWPNISFLCLIHLYDIYKLINKSCISKHTTGSISNTSLE